MSAAAGLFMLLVGAVLSLLCVGAAYLSGYEPIGGALIFALAAGAAFLGALFQSADKL